MPEKQIFKLSIAADDAVTELQTEPDDPTAEIPIAKCVFDLGVAFTSEAYPEFLEESTWVLANDWKEAYPDWYEEGANGWMPIANGESAYTITPTNISSGNITVTVNGVSLNIPYSNFTGTACTFDFAELFAGYEIEGESVVNATISEETIDITNMMWM